MKNIIIKKHREKIVDHEYRSIEELKTRSCCLVPNEKARSDGWLVTCHENDYCKCDINVLLSQLNKANIQLKNANIVIKEASCGEVFIGSFSCKVSQLKKIRKMAKKYQKKYKEE